MAQSASPAVKGEAIATVVMEHRLSECRACTLVGLCGDGYRNPTLRSEHNTAPNHQITKIVRTHRRAGYRVIHDVLRAEYAGINHKRIYQLYSEAGLAVRRKVKVKRDG